MSIGFTKQYFVFKKILEVHKNETDKKLSYVKASLSTSYKGKNGKRVYSNWIGRFIGASVDEVLNLQTDDFIYCNGSMTREPYIKDNKTIWGDAQLTIFEMHKWEKSESQNIKETPPEDDIPF